LKNLALANSDFFPDEVHIELNVLGAFMVHWVGAHVAGGDVVAEDDRGLGQWQSSSLRSYRSHVLSATAFATPRYSASALDRETVVCRFDDHERRESPMNTQNPEVEHRVSGHPAQSASE
jgi:hypothetical protein